MSCLSMYGCKQLQTHISTIVGLYIKQKCVSYIPADT